jgi:23S rRNA (cytidine1920-2'-O)/16S rRNA (cytidine1409-2'-O)-methyltransferase
VSTRPDPLHPYVSRGGLKLEHALRTFNLDPTGLDCADLGCSTGGFTDCLLRHGAGSVISVDTAYGELAWTLRNDPRVTVMERTNALHAIAPRPVDLVVIDLGWTPQRLALPAAARWLAPHGKIVTLIKPHYEGTNSDAGSGAGPVAGRGHLLDEASALAVVHEVAASLPALGFVLLGLERSPILGGGSRSKAKGNAEWLALVQPVAPRA